MMPVAPSRPVPINSMAFCPEGGVPMTVGFGACVGVAVPADAAVGANAATSSAQARRRFMTVSFRRGYELQQLGGCADQLRREARRFLPAVRPGTAEALPGAGTPGRRQGYSVLGESLARKHERAKARTGRERRGRPPGTAVHPVSPSLSRFRSEGSRLRDISCETSEN